MQDPYFAVKEEVEHSLTVVVDLHKRWMELSVDHKRGDEFEWTSSECAGILPVGMARARARPCARRLC